ncbi:hypothetical protein [Nocardioides sp. B-3]
MVVHKSSDGTVTTSGLTVLDDGERERELSGCSPVWRSPTRRSPMRAN